MDGACPNRSHLSRGAGPTSPHLLWAIDAPAKYSGSAIKFPPIIPADGAVLVTTDYVLGAITPDATVKWSFQVDDNDAIAGAPAIGNADAIYLPGVARLYAIDTSGKLRWRYGYPDYGNGNNHGGNSSAAIGPDGTIYITTVYALLAVKPDGTLRWRAPFAGGLLTSPVVGIDGAVFVWDAALHALDPHTGKLRWTFSPGADEGQPFGFMLTQALDRRLYLPSQSGNLYSLDPNGALVRRDLIEDSNGWVVADGDANIRLGRGSLNYRVESRDASGATLWSSPVEYVVAGRAGANTILDRDGTLYVLGESIRAISPAGALIWSVPVEMSVDENWTGIALGANSTLYAALGARLVAIGP